MANHSAHTAIINTISKYIISSTNLKISTFFVRVIKIEQLTTILTLIV